ncbi:MAG: hypothetical protein ACXWV9_09105 [Flavisolibacter sp.]
MRKFKYIAILCFLTACKEPVKINQSLKENSENNPQTFNNDTLMNLYHLSLTLPKGWRMANDDTLTKVLNSTSLYRFHNANGKLIHLQYGLDTYCNPSEPNVQSVRFRKGYVENKADTSDIIFTDNPTLTAIRDKSSYTYTRERISGFDALFYKPKKDGAGYTGLYIDSIGEIAGNIADFTFYAKDLDSVEIKQLIGIIKSFKINPLN